MQGLKEDSVLAFMSLDLSLARKPSHGGPLVEFGALGIVARFIFVHIFSFHLKSQNAYQH
jgi:hypothetical protein